MDGQVVNRNETLDLALVDVRGANATPLEIADASLLEPGEKVVLIGAPQGMDYTVHEGIVSHLGRNLYGVGYIQIDAAVNPGNSGGPLLDEWGQVVGVVTLKAEGADGIGFALPINYAHTGNAPVVRLSVPPSVSWDRMAAEIEAADLRDRDRAATAFARPGLLAAQSQSPGPSGIVFVVLMRSSAAPEGVDLELLLEKDGETICEMDATVVKAQSLNELAEQVTTEIPPDVRWLQGNGLADDLWYAAARPLGHRGPCAYGNLKGWEAVLLDAEPGYERATIQ
jgi:serine protease Do